jgi:hypothetical protein
MFDFSSVLASVFAGLQDLLAGSIVELITSLFTGLFPQG